MTQSTVSEIVPQPLPNDPQHLSYVLNPTVVARIESATPVAGRASNTGNAREGRRATGFALSLPAT
jgi:hypothetical protein